MDSKNFLECNFESEDKNLILPNQFEFEKKNIFESNLPSFKTVTPTPGFCMKTKTNDNKKVFVNVCKCDMLPKPKEISDEEIVNLLASDDPSSFRIPLSLGEPHVETDNSGHGCTVYDVLINESFFHEMQKREILKGFFFTIAIEGLEEKYKLQLDRNIKLLKNKKFLGTLMPQNIRTRSKPWIMEMDDEDSKITQTPKFTIIQEPTKGTPEFLVAEILLPKIKMASSLTLDIGEDRLILNTRSNIYYLDIFLPYHLNQDSCSSQYDRKTNVLTVIMPVINS